MVLLIKQGGISIASLNAACIGGIVGQVLDIWRDVQANLQAHGLPAQEHNGCNLPAVQPLLLHSDVEWNRAFESCDESSITARASVLLLSASLELYSLVRWNCATELRPRLRLTLDNAKTICNIYWLLVRGAMPLNSNTAATEAPTYIDECTTEAISQVILVIGNALGDESSEESNFTKSMLEDTRMNSTLKLSIVCDRGVLDATLSIFGYWNNVCRLLYGTASHYSMEAADEKCRLSITHTLRMLRETLWLLANILKTFSDYEPSDPSSESAEQRENYLNEKLHGALSIICDNFSVVSDAFCFTDSYGLLLLKSSVHAGDNEDKRCVNDFIELLLDFLWVLYFLASVSEEDLEPYSCPFLQDSRVFRILCRRYMRDTGSQGIRVKSLIVKILTALSCSSDPRDFHTMMRREDILSAADAMISTLSEECVKSCSYIFCGMTPPMTPSRPFSGVPQIAQPCIQLFTETVIMLNDVVYDFPADFREHPVLLSTVLHYFKSASAKVQAEAVYFVHTLLARSSGATLASLVDILISSDGQFSAIEHVLVSLGQTQSNIYPTLARMLSIIKCLAENDPVFLQAVHERLADRIDQLRCTTDARASSLIDGFFDNLF